MNNNKLALAVLIGFGQGAGIAYAQTGGDAAGDAGSRPAALEEVVVTAQRRAENLQDLPVSATALTGDMMREQGITRIIDLQSASPSLSIVDTGITLSVNIRGIGIASDSPSITAGVATYVDGLFQPPIVQANSFFDIENVEVFRGPQGTFVGSNSTGGAIFINSRDPELGEFGGYADVGVGNYNAREMEGAINLPVADDLALRFAGFSRDRDSYYEDVGPFDNDAGKLDEYGGRAGLLWNPGRFELLLKAQANRRETGGYATQPIPGTTYADYRVGDAFTLDFDVDTFYEDEADIVSLELNYELANGVVLRSLSGYQDKTVRNRADIDSSQAPLSANGGIVEDYYANEEQLSQEINIISPTDGAFDWIIGAYYQDNDIEVDIVDTQAGFPTDIPVGNQRKTTGLFAQGKYRLTPDLELEIGTRYSTYDADGYGAVSIGRGVPGFPPGGLQVADLAGDYGDSKVTGKVALNWSVHSQHLLYGSISRGYKPGGFNSTTSEFSEEEVLSYEFGWKFSALDDRVQAQLTAFYNDYSNFQFSVLEPSTGLGGVENLDDMTIQGLEAQVQGRFGGVTITANAGYTDSELEGQTFINRRRLPGSSLGPQCPPGVPSTPPACFDYGPFVENTSGGDALYAPEFTFNLGLSYDWALGGGLMLTPRVDYAHIDEQFTYLAYSPVSDTLESRDLLNASLRLAGERWKLELYGANLTDEEYVSGQFDISEFYGAPREYGVRIGVNF